MSAGIHQGSSLNWTPSHPGDILQIFSPTCHNLTEWKAQKQDHICNHADTENVHASGSYNSLSAVVIQSKNPLYH